MVQWFAAFAIMFILSMVPASIFNKTFAQDGYPTRPVKFLIPYPGGGTNDVLARIVGDKLQAKWGQPVIIENRSGGSGNIGAAAAAQIRADHKFRISAQSRDRAQRAAGEFAERADCVREG